LPSGSAGWLRPDLTTPQYYPTPTVVSFLYFLRLKIRQQSAGHTLASLRGVLNFSPTLALSAFMIFAFFSNGSVGPGAAS
jgi:hypothetical protein